MAFPKCGEQQLNVWHAPLGLICFVAASSFCPFLRSLVLGVNMFVFSSLVLLLSTPIV